MLDAARAFLREHLADRSLDSLDYAALRVISKEWCRRTGASFGHGGVVVAPERFPRRFRVAVAIADRLRLRPGTLAAAVAEVFNVCRVRRDVLAYLSLQEGLPMDGSPDASVHVGAVLDDIMRSAGKIPWGGISRRWCGFRISLSVDPLVDLRRVHLRALRSIRAGGSGHGRDIGLALARAWFVGKCWLLRSILVVARRLLAMRAPEKLLRGLLSRPAMRRNVVMGCMILFPETRKEGRRFWGELLQEIEQEFVPRILALLGTVHLGAEPYRGFSKMLKLAFGLLVWRGSSSALPAVRSRADVVHALRLAWCWSLTYPLVDDVLDGGVSRSVRQDTVQVLTAAFAVGDPMPDGCAVATPSARLLGAAMLEMVDAIAPERRERCKAVLRLVVEAHVRDSARCLATDRALDAEDEDDLWADTHLKALLVRMATIELSGATVDEDRLALMWSMALFNQLGDDLWDVVEDSQVGRVTPMTVTVTGNSRRNAFAWYLHYGEVLSRCCAGRRGLALRVGVRETIRSLLESLDDNRRDPRVARIGAVLATSMGLADIGEVRSAVAGWPHVDPDAAIFAIESAL